MFPIIYCYIKTYLRMWCHVLPVSLYLGRGSAGLASLYTARLCGARVKWSFLHSNVRQLLVAPGQDHSRDCGPSTNHHTFHVAVCLPHNNLRLCSKASNLCPLRTRQMRFCLLWPRLRSYTVKFLPHSIY